MRLNIFTFLVIFMTYASVFGQKPQLVVKVSKTKLALNQRLQIEYSLNTRGADDFQPPEFKYFQALNSRPMMSTGESVNIFNGKVERTFNLKYTFTVKPKRTGKLVIEPARININGKTIQSQSVEIFVTKAVKTPENPNDPNYVAEQNVHLVTFVNNNKPYVGEAISVEYRIYVKDVGVNMLGGFNKPKYEGFWSQSLKNDTDSEWKKGQFKGENYDYAVLEKALLIPTKSGKLYVGDISTELSVGIPVKRRDFFGNIFTTLGDRIRKTYIAPRKAIRVQELPLNNKPVDFNGAVGDFNFTVKLSKNALKANESSQVRLKVTGKGNLKSFKLPNIKTPPELEVYTPERKQKSIATTSGLKGFLKNTYTLVPQYKGKYKIPSTSFSYFNPREKKYHTIKTADLIVDVLEGKELPKTVNNSTAKQEVVISNSNNLHYIQTKTDFKPIKNTVFFNSWLYYTIILFILSIIPITLIIDNKRRVIMGDIQGNKLRKANKLVKKHLAEAKTQLGNKKAFYESLERALHNYLKAKLSVETNDISIEKINDILLIKNVNKTTIDALIDVIKNCDFARYTPITDVEMQSEYDKATEILMELDKQL